MATILGFRYFFIQNQRKIIMVEIGSITHVSYMPSNCNISSYTGNETILFVEDEDSLAELVTGVLQAEGYNVLHASDGMRALDLFLEHASEIDLVLTDLELPKLGGWDAFQQMRNIKPSIVAIVASGFFEKQFQTQMLKQGGKEFIPKPYHPVQILQAVREVLDSARPG
jgi:two-component system cell cycle sensor histidine kinase/response regulator CckA